MVSPAQVLPAGPALRGHFRAGPPSGCLPHPSRSSRPRGPVPWSPRSGVPWPVSGCCCRPQPASPPLRLPTPIPPPPPPRQDFLGFVETKQQSAAEVRDRLRHRPARVHCSRASGTYEGHFPQSPNGRHSRSSAVPGACHPVSVPLDRGWRGPPTSPTCSADAGSPGPAVG